MIEMRRFAMAKKEKAICPESSEAITL